MTQYSPFTFFVAILLFFPHWLYCLQKQPLGCARLRL